MLFVWATATQAADCSAPLAQLVLVKGSVELVRQGTMRLVVADTNASLCTGDTVVVHQRSQAALLLANSTVVRLDQGTTVVLSPSSGDRPALLSVVSGAIYVISRTPQPFRVRTPFINANVEGTEFLVEVRRKRQEAETEGCLRGSQQPPEIDRITVFEGRVQVEASPQPLLIAAGETAVASAAQGPTKVLIVRPRDAVTWTLYVPTVLSSARALPPAIACAGQLLALGLVDDAKREMARALSADVPKEAGDAIAYALLATIAVAENERDQAREYSDRAVALDAKSAPAWLARSYAQQARFQIEDALASVNQAVLLDPSSALAFARRAELQMSLGLLASALQSAQEAVRLDPQLSRTQTVLGFASLARVDTRAARTSFERASELDSTDPLPRLGLGLSRIRDGDLAGGRGEIELAAVLDPMQSLVRSYLGKAYFEELRNQLAAVQFNLAEEFDPQDPTPYFYSAIVKQEQNRLVEALDDFTRAIELNDRRVVNRSRFLLDQDVAARQVSRARTFDGLAFGSLALDGAVKAISADFSDFAAHKYLAEAYEGLPRHSLASQSESLQAELRSPITIPQPDAHFLGDASYLFRNGNFFQPGQNEFGTLFNTDGARIYFDATAGSRDTKGQRLFVGGTSDRVSYAVSESTYKTDGFESASAVDKTSYDLLVKGQVADGSTLSFYLKHSTLVVDETFFAFDPTFASASKIDDRQDLFRIGGHHVFAPGTDLVWLATRSVDHQSSRDFPDLVLSSEERATTRTVEAQLVHTLPRVQWVLGGGSTRLSEDFGGGNTIETTASSVYAYARWILPGEQTYLHAGLASEKFRLFNSVLDTGIERNRVSPKFGLSWVPNSNFSLRLASYENVRRPLIAGQTLEPTQFNGFNQVFSGIKEFFGDQDGTLSRARSVALDFAPARHVYSGISLTRRQLSVPSIFDGHDFTWKDSIGRAYLYHTPDLAWTMPWQAGLSFEYEHETFDRPQEFTGPEGIIRLRNDDFYARMRLFHPSGVAFGLTVSHIRQTGEMSVQQSFPVFDLGSKAWLADVNAEYRLPRRLGAIQFGVRNVFDRAFSVVDTDPLRPRFATRRFVFLNIRLSY